MVPVSTAFASLGHTVPLTVDCFGPVFGSAGGTSVVNSGTGPSGGTSLGPPVGHAVKPACDKANSFVNPEGSKFASATLSSVMSAAGSSSAHAPGVLAWPATEGSIIHSEGSSGINVAPSGSTPGGTTVTDTGGFANKVVHIPVAGSPVINTHVLTVVATVVGTILFSGSVAVMPALKKHPN